MSYIRSTSNPEKLYIWSNGDEVTIMMGNETVGTIPTSIFNGLIKESLNNYFDECEYKDASISDDENDFKIRLKYKNIDISMYFVTWYYIVNSNQHKL